jgi:hypothetical protein
MNDMTTDTIKSRRRSHEANVGIVNFPIERIENSGEGGCFVRLIVIDKKGDAEYMNRWQPCCGGDSYFFMDECFLGDDLFSRPNNNDWEEHNRLMRTCENRYFPNLNSEEPFAEQNKYTSRHFLCVMTIGASGWSSSKWVCTRSDLTPEGQFLIASLERLYPDCEIRLLTFLDT